MMLNHQPPNDGGFGNQATKKWSPFGLPGYKNTPQKVKVWSLRIEGLEDEKFLFRRV